MERIVGILQAQIGPEINDVNQDLDFIRIIRFFYDLEGFRVQNTIQTTRIFKKKENKVVFSYLAFLYFHDFMTKENVLRFCIVIFFFNFQRISQINFFFQFIGIVFLYKIFHNSQYESIFFKDNYLMAFLIFFKNILNKY